MRPEALDLKKLKAFQLTAVHGGLRLAAVRLGLTVPAVSFQIRRLEQELGVELFQRSASGLVLTKAGEHFLQEANAIFERVEHALASMVSGNVVSGQISVSTGSDIVWYFTPKISSFIRRYPGIQLRHHVYNSVQTLQMVGAGTIDVGIGYFPRVPKSLAKEIVTESALSLLCPRNHPLSRRHPFRLDDVARYKLVLPPGQSTTRKIIDRVFSKAKIKPPDVLEVGSCHAAREFVETGIGVAIVHSFCVSHGLPVELRSIDASAQFGTVDFSIIYRKEGASSVLLRGLLDQLTAHAET
jgi:DNA-binding transcriptional LysR family regulator